MSTRWIFFVFIGLCWRAWSFVLSEWYFTRYSTCLLSCLVRLLSGPDATSNRSSFLPPGNYQWESRELWLYYTASIHMKSQVSERSQLPVNFCVGMCPSRILKNLFQILHGQNCQDENLLGYQRNLSASPLVVVANKDRCSIHSMNKSNSLFVSWVQWILNQSSGSSRS